MQKIIDQITAYLKDYLTPEFKAFYQGDPIAPPIANLPCLFVEGIRTTAEAGATGTDELTHTIQIGIIMNKLSEIGKNADENVSHRKLIELIADRNTDGTYKDNSIIGILRKYFTLGETINNQILDVEYGINERNGIITAEARITARISELVIVASRT